MIRSAARRLLVCALALAALLGALPASAAAVLANYTFSFHPPSPNCNATDLGDLSTATLSGALSFATLDSFGSYVTIQPGPTQLGGIACGGSLTASFSFDSGAGNPEVFVSFGGDLVHPPNPNLPTYAFAAGTDPASLTDPGSAPWLSLGVPVGKDPGPTQLPLYAFSSGAAYQIGTLDATVQTVPLPAAAWLFESGLLGLIGVARRKAL